MKRIVLVGAATIFGLLSGCTSMNAPSTSLIDELPVIEIGSPDVLTKEFVLLIPANKTFPVDVSIGGNVFAETSLLSTMVNLKGDLYLYQYWASRDGKNWMRLDDMFNLDVFVGASASGGKTELKLDYAE